MRRNVLEYLEETARRLPEKPAFTDEKREVPFGRLMENARRLGTVLAASTDAVNSPVAVLVGRRVSTLEAFFGVLYSGNYYVPVDNAMPRQRMERLLEVLSPAVILYDPEDEGLALQFADRWPVLCTEKQSLYEVDDALLAQRRERVLDIDPVYVIFTSGSTGTPKGIVVTHRGVIDLTEWLTSAAGYRSEDVFGNQAPFFFDGSVKDVYAPLKLGATVHILPKKLFSFPMLLLDALKKKEITVLQWATSAFNLMASSGVMEKGMPQRLRIVAAAGETMQAKHLNAWRRALPNARFINLYGPTEVTVDCAYYIVDREFRDTDAVPIGRACANKEILLLDENLAPVPDGQPGEICVRGTGVAKGYYNDPEKTAAAFVQNPLNPAYPDILYRTGDIAVRNSRGELVFQSRRDGQIKHMGYRIELGEIERAVAACPDVGDGFCFYDEEKDQIVCLYEGEPEGQALIRSLREYLPKYMLPNLALRREMLRNPNGKLDRPKMREEYYNARDGA